MWYTNLTSTVVYQSARSLVVMINSLKIRLETLFRTHTCLRLLPDPIQCDAVNVFVNSVWTKSYEVASRTEKPAKC